MPETAPHEVLFSSVSGLCTGENNFDIVGVTGSIPVTPTIQALEKLRRAAEAAKCSAGSMNLPYLYRWDRQGRKGQLCRVLARGTMNSCCVEFGDGFRMVTSRNALRKAPRQHPVVEREER